MIKGTVRSAALCVFVNGMGYTHTIMRCRVNKEDGKNMVELLTEEYDTALTTFFPEAKGE
jgi:hypothetical protein